MRTSQVYALLFTLAGPWQVTAQREHQWSTFDVVETPTSGSPITVQTSEVVTIASNPVATPLTTALSVEKSQGAVLQNATIPASAISVAPAPVNAGVMTIAITNYWTAPLSVSYFQNSDSPSAVGAPQPAPLGTTTQVVFPTNWAGRIVIGKTTDADGSKIEGSTTVWNDIDVSYVDGFSVPIVCSNATAPVTGCNINLWDVSGPCNDTVGEDAVCLNPMQGVPDGPAAPWFLPCQGVAYTFPNDNVANDGNTGTADISCCVGTGEMGCSAPAMQGKGNDQASKRAIPAPEKPLKVEEAADLDEGGSRLPHARSHHEHKHHEHRHLKKHVAKARYHGQAL